MISSGVFITKASWTARIIPLPRSGKANQGKGSVRRVPDDEQDHVGRD
jgi:hypothetical protein